MVFSPPDKAYAMEIYDNPAGPARIEMVPPPKLGGYIKQALWEEGCWDTEEEDLLLHLNAAHLRSFLGAAGVMPWEYVLYSGGCAKLAGLSCHVHGYEFGWMSDISCGIFGMISGEDNTAFCAYWRSLSVADRAARFRELALAPSAEARELLPLEAFHRACRDEPTKAISVYLGSPLTALATTVETAPDVVERVVYISAMSTAWDGSQNLLGLCFNNAVDYEATKFCLGKFPNGRFLMIPTEACKMGPFTHRPEVIEALPAIPEREATRAVLGSVVRHWTSLKRNEPQALFDTVTAMPLLDLIDIGAIVTADVVFNLKNEFALGTIYEDFGMALRNHAAPPPPPPAADGTRRPQPVATCPEQVHGRLARGSPFPANVIYALERVFTPEAPGRYMDMLSGMLQTP